MSDFKSDIQHWPTHERFAAHLAKHDPIVCNWVKAVVIHHTWKPVASGWRGLASVESLRRFYIAKGWTSAPHLFICAGAPNPAHDGIFQLTPLNLTGTHAGAVCNRTTIGIEVIGDYDDAPWPDNVATLVSYALAHFMEWRSLGRNAIIGHRNCNSPKTCPGKAVSIERVQNMVWTKRRLVYAHTGL
jgi:hypothetical protein